MQLFDLQMGVESVEEIPKWFKAFTYFQLQK